MEVEVMDSLSSYKMRYMSISQWTGLNRLTICEDLLAQERYFYTVQEDIVQC